MIPPEIIALISSHALLSFSAYPRNSPTLLDIPSPFNLTRYPDIRPQNRQISTKPVSLAKQSIDDHFCARPNIANALQAAITTGIDPILDHPVNDHNPEIGVPFGNRVFIPKTSLSLSVSMNIPTSTTFHASSESSITPLPDMPKRSTKLHNLLSPLNDALKHIPPPSPRNPGNALSFSTWVSESGHCASSPYSATSPPHFTIGNLFLSSCPGKKGILDLHILIRQCHSFFIP